ncbi:hypothetical protein ARMGADRAFT_456908 [Armillaria gallica]|uniref:Uncharacterized protein n=1 Tax=Armillaria gallica TaxID=47427 RepID=A0A2H3DJ67_ARMGA|nr:hypothetical protein ARMGADRAFT_456908 [Armillaria gallica]
MPSDLFRGYYRQNMATLSSGRRRSSPGINGGSGTAFSVRILPILSQLPPTTPRLVGGSIWRRRKATTANRERLGRQLMSLLGGCLFRLNNLLRTSRWWLSSYHVSSHTVCSTPQHQLEGRGRDEKRSVGLRLSRLASGRQLSTLVNTSCM